MRVWAVIGAGVLLSGGFWAGSDLKSAEATRSVTYRDPTPDAFMSHWLICGPFPILDREQKEPDEAALKRAFARDFLTEHGGESQVQPTPGLTHHLGGEEYPWKAVVGGKESVDLNQIYGPKENVVAYASAEIVISAPRTALLGIGSDDAVKVWLNGELIHENWVFRGVIFDQDLVPVHLRRGKNRLLLKVLNGGESWGFACRLVSERSAALSRSRALIEASAAGDRTPSALRQLLDQFERDLSTGPERLNRNWTLGLIADNAGDWIHAPLSPAFRYQLAVMANQLAATAKNLPIASQKDAYRLAAWFYYGTGHPGKAIAACEQALRLPGSRQDARALLSTLRWQAKRKREAPPVDAVDLILSTEMRKTHTPGASIAVVRDGNLILAKGYGLANVELSVPASKDSVYQLASVTKPFTATAIMMLVEEGKIALDERISHYLPESPAAWNDVTIRHLLTHTSGITNSYWHLPAYAKMMWQEPTRQEIFRVVAGLPLDFPPGERWSYSNTGYQLLGMIGEKVSRRPYDQFLKERIFQPLGMTATRLNDYRSVIRNRASGYTWDNGALRNDDNRGTSQFYGSTGLVSTVVDLARWDRALYTERFLKRSILQQMWTPAKLRDGTTPRPWGGGYGFGWILLNQDGHRLIGHGGIDPGFTADINRYVDDRLTVIMLSNNAVDPGVAGKIAALYLPPPRPMEDPDPKNTRRLKGVLLGLVSGQVDAAQLTPELLHVLRPERKQVSAFYRSLGPLRSFYLIERSDAEPQRTYHYRAVYRDTTWIQTFVLNQENKIIEVSIGPAS